MSDSSHSCIQEAGESPASISSVKSAAMLGLALSVGASGVLIPQSEASAVISVPATSTNQAFSSDSQVSAPAQARSQSLAQPGAQAEIVAYHTVTSGQSLWQIAQLHRVGLRDLKTANELPVETSIRVGQVLKVPTSDVIAQSPTQQIIRSLATRSSESALVASSDLTLEVAETVAKAKISEQIQPQQALPIEGLDVSERVSQREVPQLDEAQVEDAQVLDAQISIEIASADVGSDVVSSEQASVQANTSAEEQATEQITEQTTGVATLPTEIPGESPKGNPEGNPEGSLEFEIADTTEIADATLTERQVATDAAPVVAAALATPAQSYTSYQIQAGDTIAGIAASLGTTKAELISANDLADPNVIMTGATLIVPAVDGRETARQLSQPATSSATERPAENSRLAYLQRTAIRQSASNAIEERRSRETQLQAGSDQSTAAQGGIDPYVASLLEEVQEIQSEPVRVAEAEITKVESRLAERRIVETRADENRVSPSPRVTERVAIAPAQANPQTDAQIGVADPSLLAAAPLSPDAYTPAQRSPTGQVVSPDMPLLPEADEFLPEAPNYFDGYIWPTRGTLTSGYGWRWGRMHRGVDVAGPVGTPIVAAGSGVVETAGWNSGGYGNMVEIRHPDGSLTLYAHNSRLNVTAGQTVRQGQKIAEMGSTGYSTGPHLHFEIHLGGQGAVNPMAHLPGR